MWDKEKTPHNHGSWEYGENELNVAENYKVSNILSKCFQ